MTSMTIMMKIKHFSQPTGNSCGPTCLKMVKDYLDDYPDYNPHEFHYFSKSVEEIMEICQTDWIVGTPPNRMELGMKKLSLKYVEYINPPRPFEFLKEIISSKNIPILRTITFNVPHWILIKGYSENNFLVNDPWLGEIIYTEKELDNIWKLRNYQFYEIINDEYSDVRK